MIPKYRFLLQIGETGEKQEVKPLYKDDLALEYALESGQKFYRAQLSGKLNFIRGDYDTINDAAFDAEFFLYIEKSNDWGLTYNEYHKSRFTKTDCTFNDDSHIVTVQPETVDEYNKVLAGLEKEYNLTEIAPEIEYLTIKKRPLIQIYIPGDSKISCFLSGMHWEQDANSVSAQDQLVNTYHFALCNIIKQINITSVELNPPTPSDVTGLYFGSMSYLTAPNRYQGRLYRQDNSDYYIEISQIMEGAYPHGSVSVRLYRTSDSTMLFFYNHDNTDEPFDTETFSMTSDPAGGAAGALNASMTSYNVYGRFLCDVDSIDGTPTLAIPSSDIVSNNRNYSRVIGYALGGVYMSRFFSEEPTKYGKASNGQYFMPPYTLTNENFLPLLQTMWTDFSLWFSFGLFYEMYDNKARKSYTLRNAYTLSSCINVLLKQFAPEVKHEATEEYSQFLYGEENPISGDSFKLLITPKSNIINGDYNTPAQREPITLQQIMNALANIYRCYWYIEDGKFKIEQVNYFRNGGSYSFNPIISYDLTALENVRNRKKLAFATSEYSFEKEEMPERYQFSWPEDVSEAFEGFPIEITSKYVTEGNIEEINMSNFTTDIDLMLLNPSAFSSDGFALFAAVYPEGGGQLELPFTNNEAYDVEYNLQNGYLALVDVLPKYWVYDMPSRYFKINGITRVAVGIKRNKKQELSFPAGNDDPNPMQLIKTYLGNGQVEKLSLNLSSRHIKATLKYDTE